ncbi:hypothetical protein XBJ1_3807 [Xenorhabdus bovienii SS-2004]|uniref:Uncharacterized protein n=1 Tax=Xenorhabdus bovienii (strain SS-2004) TaxID=406818 RepID=D3V5J6_XENBS|nr:hypothetical protein XBJ1_3807 [Xenorhabdus bovienii SS-2004]
MQRNNADNQGEMREATAGDIISDSRNSRYHCGFACQRVTFFPATYQ